VHQRLENIHGVVRGSRAHECDPKTSDDRTDCHTPWMVERLYCLLSDFPELFRHLAEPTGHARGAFKKNCQHNTLMLDQSFIFLPGVQERTERQLWEQGITSWDHLLDAKSVRGVGQARLKFWQSRIRELQRALDSPQRTSVLKRLFGTRWSWRLFAEVMDNPRYVDIETTEFAHEVTVVGVSDGDFYQAFVNGRNLDVHALRSAFQDCSCIITFNGSSFDLPIIDRMFPGVLPEVPHLDVRHICAQAGFRGGLKQIEKELAIQRAGTLRDVDGTDAILLWYRHVAGDEHALEELVDYNAADCLNLKPLLEFVIPRLWENLRMSKNLNRSVTP